MRSDFKTRLGYWHFQQTVITYLWCARKTQKFASSALLSHCPLQRFSSWQNPANYTSFIHDCSCYANDPWGNCFWRLLKYGYWLLDFKEILFAPKAPMRRISDTSEIFRWQLKTKCRSGCCTYPSWGRHVKSVTRARQTHNACFNQFLPGMTFRYLVQLKQISSDSVKIVAVTRLSCQEK